MRPIKLERGSTNRPLALSTLVLLLPHHTLVLSVPDSEGSAAQDSLALRAGLVLVDAVMTQLEAQSAAVVVVAVGPLAVTTTAGKDLQSRLLHVSNLALLPMTRKPANPRKVPAMETQKINLTAHVTVDPAIGDVAMALTAHGVANVAHPNLAVPQKGHSTCLPSYKPLPLTP